MALTTTEEAQLRRLIDQLAALESLAASEALISSKLGAQKVNLSQLPAATAANPDDLLVIRQGTVDKSINFGSVSSAIAGGSLVATQNLTDVVNKQTAFDTIKQPATELATGVVEFASDAETQAGSDATRATHPRGVLAAFTSFFTGKKATQAQMDAGTDDNSFLTALKVKAGLTVQAHESLQLKTQTSAGTNGYIRLPAWMGRIQICYGWGRVAVTTTIGASTATGSRAFPVAFANLWGITANVIANGSDGSEASEVRCNVGACTLDSFGIIFTREQGSNPSLEQTAFNYIAIGNY